MTGRIIRSVSLTVEHEELVRAMDLSLTDFMREKLDELAISYEGYLEQRLKKLHEEIDLLEKVKARLKIMPLDKFIDIRKGEGDTLLKFYFTWRLKQTPADILRELEHGGYPTTRAELKLRGKTPVQFVRESENVYIKEMVRVKT